jgi:hypothetical protein
MAVIEAISTTYLEADDASVTFSGIPTTYEHLQLRVSVIGTSGLQNALYYLNGDTTGGNYARHYMYGGGSSIYAAAVTGSPMWGLVPASTANPTYGCAVIDILDYRNTNKNTTLTGFYGQTATDIYSFFASSLWDNTAPVTSVQLLPAAGSFGRGSEFTLYGLNSS